MGLSINDVNIVKEQNSDILNKLSSDISGKIISALEAERNGEYDLWEASKVIWDVIYNAGLVEADCEALKKLTVDIRNRYGIAATESTKPCTVVFGTSGWRGIIGDDFTCSNVAKVSNAILQTLQTQAFLDCNGYKSFDEVKSHGIIIFRDNRYMGDEFIEVAANEFSANGVKTMVAGECPTGVGSALVTELSAACSINFTPSHNPFEYAGMKFNPGDGGPAGPELTSLIEKFAMENMSDDSFATPAAANQDLIETVDAKSIFTKFVAEKSKVFNLAEVREWLIGNATDISLVVDFMHGASRGYVEHLLGNDVVAKLQENGSLTLLNTNDDYSFHGVKPEPSATNQKPLIDILNKNKRTYTLAVALDPDADRIRFSDADMDVDMNRFGPLAYASLLQKGFKGGVCTTVASSGFALEIARQEGEKTFETAVGFKNFRAPLSSQEAIVAFEESDGISVVGHTLEKCALAGFLAVLSSMVTTGKNISTQFSELQEKYGYFYPDKDGADVKGISVDEWQAYKNAVLETLQGMYKPGDTITINGEAKEVVQVLTDDGAKMIFTDKSWVLLRPSGTEPKFRYYYELASTSPIKDQAPLLKAYNDAAGEILAKAREIVDNK